ncbi:LacI family DNA-binding transcriptional regulator [Alkalibacterium psychrotolerans]
MVGLKDVATKANVSMMTVSNVLNGKSNVSDSTKEKVLKVCKDLNYVPNYLGKGLKNGGTNVIVFNFSDFERSFYLRIIQGINEYLNDNGYNFIICTNETSEIFMRSSISRGAISLDSKMSDDYLTKIASDNYPIVLMDRILSSSMTKSVLAENFLASYMLTEKLINNGYEKFAYIKGLNTLDTQERFEGFKKALQDYDIELNENNIYTGDFTKKSGYEVGEKIISFCNVDAILSANDNMALGVLKAAEENSIKVPEDIGIVGFDNTEIARSKGLTSVSIPRYHSGVEAAKLLIKMIDGVEDKTEVIRIETKINWRKTTKVLDFD